MSKLILMSIGIALIWIPVHVSKERDAKKATRKLVKNMLVFLAIYLFALRFIWGRFD
jgi:hypothetical protein